MFEVKAHVQIGLHDLDCWKQHSQALAKTLPAQAATLASSPKRLNPHTQHDVAERLHPRPVTRNGVILEIPPHHLLQPLHRVWNSHVHPLSQLRSNLLKLRCHPFADRLPMYSEIARRVVAPTDVGETQKVERFRFPFSSLLPSLSGIAPELDQTRLLR